MTTYRYPAANIVDEIVFEKTENGSVRAYLHACGAADMAALTDIRKSITAQGWQAIPSTQDGKPVLEIRGFMREDKLLTVAEKKHWVQGVPEISKPAEPKLTFVERLKKRSLQASGAFFLVGDAAFTKYGYSGGSVWNTAGGVFYGAGTLSLLGFGNKDKTDLQVRDISKHLAQYMKEHGSDLPHNCSLDAIAKEHKKGLIASTYDLFRRYPSEMMNVFFAAAGLCIGIAAHKSLKETRAIEELVKSGKPLSAHFAQEVEEVFERKLSKKPLALGADKAAEKVKMASEMLRQHKTEAWLDIGLGTMTGASGLFAMAVKEKVKDPDAPEKTGVAGVWEKIQHKPLAIAGAGYLVSTLCHAVSTAIAWKYAGVEKRKSVPFRAIFVAANIAAEILITISSKGHGIGVKSDRSVDDTVIALAAEAIATQPKKMHNILIENIGNFLGSNDVLAVKDKDVTEKLRAQVELMKNNPWAACKPVADNERKKTYATQEASENSWQHIAFADAAISTPIGR